MSEYVSDAHAEYDRQQVEKLIRADQCIRELEAKVERLCKKYEKDTGRQAKIVADQRAENERLREDYAKLRDALEHVSESEDRLRAEVKRLRVFEAAFAKVPQEQQARIMAAVRAEMGKRHLPT